MVHKTVGVGSSANIVLSSSDFKDFFGKGAIKKKPSTPIVKNVLFDKNKDSSAVTGHLSLRKETSKNKSKKSSKPHSTQSTGNLSLKKETSKNKSKKSSKSHSTQSIISRSTRSTTISSKK